MTSTDRQTLELLEQRLKILLPEAYQETYESMEPAPMKSAGLKFDADGQVAWDQIWGSFCDLAMAGGPPHKGTLLAPGNPQDIEAHAHRYEEVAEEICRGITLATDLDARLSSTPGWVRVACYSEEMAGWLLRAICMENVAVRSDGLLLFLPAAPHYRLDKEIKNVVTVIAKTSHYWVGHMPRTQRLAIAELFAAMAVTEPLVEPAPIVEGDARTARAMVVDRMLEEIGKTTGLRRAVHSPNPPNQPTAQFEWCGLECPNVRAAIWMMRALVATNVLSRREGTVLFVPLNGATDPGGARVARAVRRTYHLAAARGLV